ncbi:unnamed protein product [Caenorhabditis nigoni]
MSQTDLLDKNVPGLSCAQHENYEQDSAQSGTPAAPAIKKRFVLVSRRIVTVHGPLPAAGASCFPPIIGQMSLASSQGIQISHRVCLICRLMKPVSEIVIITDKNDKLFVILSAIYRRKMDFTPANRMYKHSPFYACSSHLPEASAEILKMFGVSSAVRILKARSRKASQVEAFARHVSRNSYISVDKLLSLAYSFTQKHPHPFEPVGPVVREEEVPCEETIECKSDVQTEAIVPKCFREPRKQRFEKEDKESVSSLLRIIRREPIHLPIDRHIYPKSALQRPIKCCYCFEIHEKEAMLNIPKTRTRIALWAESIGNEFSERLWRNPVNYMCKKHFTKYDLSPQGRLRRNAMPNFAPQLEVHTFKIYGDRFVKVEENHMDDDRGDSSDIDIEN